MNARRTFGKLCLLTVALLGCSASTSNGPEPSSPFTEQDARLFDDSVDYAENVQDLGGRVANQWRRQVDGLSHGADLIALVRVETVNSGHEPNGASLYRLDAVAATVPNVTNPIKGALPNDHRVELRVSEGAAGFNQVRGNESRLQSAVYVLWARWYRDTDNTVRAHWHLSPNNPQLLARVREAIGYVDPNAPRETVIRNN